MLVVSEENKLNGEENKTSVDCSNKLNSQKIIFEKFNVYLFLPRLGENRMRKVLFSTTDRIIIGTFFLGPISVVISYIC